MTIFWRFCCPLYAKGEAPLLSQWGLPAKTPNVLVSPKTFSNLYCIISPKNVSPMVKILSSMKFLLGWPTVS